MSEKEVAKKLKKIELEKELFLRQHELRSMHQSLTRGRSINVGNAFGGTVEISIRGEDNSLWVLLQPVEVIELIHQLAGNIGCHIHVKPRDDFASWREWKDSSQLASGNPSDHLLDYDKNQLIATKLPPPAEQPGVKKIKNSRNKNEPLAIKKSNNK